ncbi:MAG: hypothetical protein ACTSYB_04895 [Candidatus Helarchaeota archaeon]
MDTAMLDTVVKEIISKMGSILGVRVYIGIVDGLGNIIHMDRELEQFKEFIINFIRTNFKYLKVGDHSLPISGKNIMFFRLSKAIIILYSAKGRVGQLLSFKSLLPKYESRIDEIVGDISVEPAAAELVVEEIPPEPETISSVPVKTIEKTIFSRNMVFYSEIYPQITKKIKESSKFSLIISVILNYSNGNNSFLDIFDKLDIDQDRYLQELFKLYKANKIKFPGYELIQVNCPECKSEAHKFIPQELLKASPCEYIRFQIAPKTCEHTYYVILDKKGKIKPKAIPKISDISDEIDFSELSIENLIKFFGQDIFFSIFHAVFFKYTVIFLESTNFGEFICEFMKNFFQQVSYGKEIQSLPREDYLKKSKRYADALIIDLASNIICNEPYESEDFDFELRLFRKVLKEKDEHVQVLKTHSEFERLILLIDTILNEIEMYEEIKEDELIDLMKKKHNIILERSEIPIIKELADIYYSVDIRKKITKTLVGKVSDFFQSI